MITSTFNLVTSEQRANRGSGAKARLDVGSSPETWALGRVLSGRLRIERLIGTGAMGMVWEARHLELDTRVAVKAILPEMQAVPGMLSLFAREAKAAAGIRSEHVPQVFDVGTDDAIGPYMVMEYLAGRDLRALLDLEGRLPAARAIDYILQACEALAVAHAQGVIHRDIKPGNLFLTRQGELEVIKLLDFGVSKAALTGRLFGGELSGEEAAALKGTPLYMAPEQIHAPEQVDQRSDIWALGAVLYELVTGHSVFPQTSDLAALLFSICDTAPPPLAAHCSGLSPLQGVIDQCLDKNPARRFQNVAELAYALFPLASARSQLHAHRAASILGMSSSAEHSRGDRALLAPAALASKRQHKRGSPRPFRAVRWVPRGRMLTLLLGLAALSLVGGGARWLESLSDAPRIDSVQGSVATRPEPLPAPPPNSGPVELQQPAKKLSANDSLAAARVNSARAVQPSSMARRRAAAPPGSPKRQAASVPSGTPLAPKLTSPARPRLRLVEDNARLRVAGRL